MHTAHQPLTRRLKLMALPSPGHAARAMRGAAEPIPTLEVLVASKNMVKINAVRQAVEVAFPHALLCIHGVDVSSGVSNQPIGERETLKGARNRVAQLRAWQQERQQHSPPGVEAILVAIEGGVRSQRLAMSQPKWQGSGIDGVPHTKGLMQGIPVECFSWVVVEHGATQAESIARSGSFMLPAPLSDLVAGGTELGDADDQVFGRHKSGQGTGTVGHLSKGLITRTSLYEQAVILALLPFLQPEHYGSASFGLAANSLSQVPTASVDA